MNRTVHVIVGPQGSGKTGVGRALLRGMAQSGVVTCVGYRTLLNPFDIGSVLLSAPAAVLVDEIDRPPTVELLERLSQPFQHDTIVADRRGLEPVIVATPWLAIVCLRVVGSLKGHPFLREVRVL